MNELNKLIQQYEKENPGKAAQTDVGHLMTVWNDEFVQWQADQIKKLASRPTCGKEQRKFLDVIELKGKFDKSNDTITYFDFQKVLKGE